MNDTPFSPGEAIGIAVFQLTVLLFVTRWLDRRSGPPQFSIRRTLGGSLILLLIAAPFWGLLYYLALINPPADLNRWIPVLLVFAPLMIALGWGHWRFLWGPHRIRRESTVATRTLESTKADGHSSDD